MASSKDVARQAGVSVATISRVYSYPDQVKPETRDRVLNAARELNYYPNMAARNLKSQRNNAIGIVVNDFANPFFFQVIDRINRKFESTNYQVLTFSLSENFFSNEKLNLYLSSNQLDAFLFTPYYYVKSDEQFFRNIRPYCLQLYSDCYECLDSLTIDDQYGTYIAVSHLLKQGHRKILLLTEDLNHAHQHIRMDGYIQAYLELNLTPDLAYARHFSPKVNNVDAIAAAVRSLKPTAIVCHAETLSISTLSVLRSMGLDYPRDISLILYDDHPWAEAMGISAVAQPISFVGDAIVDRLMTALHQTPPRPIVKESIKPELILRDSVRPSQ